VSNGISEPRSKKLDTAGTWFPSRLINESSSNRSAWKGWQCKTCCYLWLVNPNELTILPQQAEICGRPCLDCSVAKNTSTHAPNTFSVIYPLTLSVQTQITTASSPNTFSVIYPLTHSVQTQITTASFVVIAWVSLSEALGNAYLHVFFSNEASQCSLYISTSSGAAMSNKNGYWAKNYVNILIRTAQWMTYFDLSKVNLV